MGSFRGSLLHTISAAMRRPNSRSGILGVSWFDTTMEVSPVPLLREALTRWRTPHLVGRLLRRVGWRSSHFKHWFRLVFLQGPGARVPTGVYCPLMRRHVPQHPRPPRCSLRSPACPPILRSCRSRPLGAQGVSVARGFTAVLFDMTPTTLCGGPTLMGSSVGRLSALDMTPLTPSMARGVAMQGISLPPRIVVNMYIT
jgi:hypothetical protein